MKIWLVLFGLMSSSTALARIGESLDQCQLRYGTMIGTDMTRSNYPAYVFRKDGIEIRVRLYNGKSAQEMFFGIGSELTTVQIGQIASANLGSDVKAHRETFNPRYDDKSLAALGIKVARIDREKRQLFGITVEKELSYDPKVMERTLAHFGVEPNPHPLGINGEDGKGEVLVITTSEFDRILAGMSGF